MSALDIGVDEASKNIGALPTIGGLVTTGAPFSRGFSGSKTYAAIFLRVGSAPSNAGTLVVEDAEGKPIVFRGVYSGEYIPVAKARRVLASAVTPEGTFTTDCTFITWLGGSK